MNQLIKKYFILCTLILLQMACASYRVEKLKEHSELSLQNIESAFSSIEKDYQYKLSLITSLKSDSQNSDSNLYKIFYDEFQKMTHLRSEIVEKKEQILKYNKFFYDVGMVKSDIKKGDDDYHKVLQYRSTTRDWEKEIQVTFNNYTKSSEKINKLLMENQIYYLEPRRLMKETQVFRRKIERTTKLNHLQIVESLKRRQGMSEAAKGESQKILVELESLLTKIQEDLDILMDAEGQLKSYFLEGKDKVIVTPTHSAHEVVLKIKKYGLQIQDHANAFNNLNSKL